MSLCLGRRWGDGGQQGLWRMPTPYLTSRDPRPPFRTQNFIINVEALASAPWVQGDDLAPRPQCRLCSGPASMTSPHCSHVLPHCSFICLCLQCSKPAAMRWSYFSGPNNLLPLYRLGCACQVYVCVHLRAGQQHGVGDRSYN